VNLLLELFSTLVNNREPSFITELSKYKVTETLSALSETPSIQANVLDLLSAVLNTREFEKAHSSIRAKLMADF
jgi:hypothetical protein